MSIDEKLDKLIEMLTRIEDRQIKTTRMVTQVKEHEAPVMGSFGTAEIPEPEERK